MKKPIKIYTITAFEDLCDKYGVNGFSRCFGFYADLETAKERLKNNTMDINETIYNYAVIEEVGEGIHYYAQKRWFYKFDYEKGIYYPIDEPEELKQIVNFGIG